MYHHIFIPMPSSKLMSVRNVSISFSRHFSSTPIWAKSSLNSLNVVTNTYDDNCDSMSSRSESTSCDTVLDDTNPALDSSLNLPGSPSSGRELQRAAFRGRTRVSKAQVVLVCGPPG